MSGHQHLSGVYAAAVTPLNPNGTLDADGLVRLLSFLGGRGCQGVLLLGTTGEGPSFAPSERLQIFRAAASNRQNYPTLRLLAGTGTPSLEETIALTRSAFDLGFEGVVVLPPYYYRKVSDDGLFTWYSAVLQRAVPAEGFLLGYHIPPLSGINLSLDLLSRLKDSFPRRFAGIKDSSGDAEHARQLGQRFSDDLLVLTGNDRLFSLALEHQASGCITAMANLLSPNLRQAWDSHRAGHQSSLSQELLTSARAVLDRYPPMPPLIKAMLHHLHGFPAWTVRPPLLPLSAEATSAALQELQTVVGTPN